MSPPGLLGLHVIHVQNLGPFTKFPKTFVTVHIGSKIILLLLVMHVLFVAKLTRFCKVLCWTTPNPLYLRRPLLRTAGFLGSTGVAG